MLFMGTLLWGVQLLSILLFSLFERRLKPSRHVGLSIREAAAFEASLRSQLEALSQSMWVLSALLTFVCLQNFAPENSSLFNTLVTFLSKSLAHQASLTATHTAFLGLKRRQFYLSHLPSCFSDVNKCAMLSSPVVLASSLFSEQDVARLLADTQTSSSLRSQQALVDVVVSSSAARSRRSSPARSPSRSSPARRRRRESGSPSRPQMRLSGSHCGSARFQVGFSQIGVMSFVRHRGCLANHWEAWDLGGRFVGCRGPLVRLPDSVGRCGGRSARERSSRASSFGSGLLQSPPKSPGVGGL